MDAPAPLGRVFSRAILSTLGAIAAGHDACPGVRLLRRIVATSSQAAALQVWSTFPKDKINITEGGTLEA